MKVANDYSSAPVTIEMALFSIFKLNADRFTQGLSKKIGSSITECIAAGQVIAINSDVDYDELMALLCAKSWDLVGRKPMFGDCEMV